MSPLVILALVFELKSPDASLREKILSIFVTLSLVGVVCLPEVLMKTRGQAMSRPEVILGFTKPLEQTFNGIRHIIDHIPPQIAVPIVEKIAQLWGVEPGIVTGVDYIFFPNEDLAGNPIQFVAALVLILLALVLRNRTLRLLSLMTIFSWFLLHGIVINQTWMSRLQTPWFALLIPVFGYFLLHMRIDRRIVSSLIAVVLIHALFTQAWVTLSRLKYSGWGVPIFEESRFHAYYYRRVDARLEFARIDSLLRQCERIKLVSGGDDYDYPVAWLAVTRGVPASYRLDRDDVSEQCQVNTQVYQ